MKQRLNPSTIAPPAPHYSHGVLTPAGMRTLHVSGQVALAANGDVPPNVEQQLELIWGNITAILAEAGMTLADIVSVRGYLVHTDAVPAYRAAFRDRLLDVRPASTLVVVKALVSPHLLAEIEVVAIAA